MKNKFISAKEAAAMIKDGDFVMVGGFLGHGTPDSIINAIADSDVKDLTVAACCLIVLEYYCIYAFNRCLIYSLEVVVTCCVECE